MKLRKKKSAAGAAVLLASAFTASAMADTAYLTCEQDLTALDGGKTTVEVIRKADGQYRVDVTKGTNKFGPTPPEARLRYSRTEAAGGCSTSARTPAMWSWSRSFAEARTSICSW